MIVNFKQFQSQEESVSNPRQDAGGAETERAPDVPSYYIKVPAYIPAHRASSPTGPPETSIWAAFVGKLATCLASPVAKLQF